MNHELGNDLELLRVRETAALLHVSTKTIYRLIARGSLPSQRVGKQHRLRRADLTKDIFLEGEPAEAEKKH